MPCCKAEKYKWCSEQDTVYTDKKGNKYCVFHAPEEKGQTQDNFNKLIFKKIQEAIDEKEKCDLSGTIFPWEIAFGLFNKDNPLPDLNFSFSIFSGDSDFQQAAFSGHTKFGKAAFSDKANFMGTAFSGDVEFEQATFSGDADFDSAVFRKEAYFGKAAFNGNVSFYNTAFNGYANFMQTAFSERAGFYEAAFSDKANFMGTAFSGDADFGRAAFMWSAAFLEAIFSGNANFDIATFSGNASFENVYFIGRTYFKETTFSKDVLFRMCSADKLIYFENIDLSHVSFLDSDPLMMHFTNCKWIQKFGRNVLFDEMEMNKEQGAFEKVEYLYRKLKHKYKAENNEPEVSNWHYGEKEMFRKKLKKRRFNPISFSNLYWASSGYGERPIRAFMVLILLLASVTILMNVFGLNSTPSGQEKFGVEIIKGFSGVIEWNKLWLLILNTIQNVLFIRDTFFEPQTLAGTIILTVTTKVIIPIQAALFVLALRNKFRR